MAEIAGQSALGAIEYSDEPVVLLFGDSKAALDRAREATVSAGCRIAAAESVTRAAERIELHAGPDAVVVELEREGEEASALLAKLEAAASAGRYRSVVSAPETMIDFIAACAPHSDVIHLCEPGKAERALSVFQAIARRIPMLHDIGRGEGAALLQQLSEETGRIAAILASLSEDDLPSSAAPLPPCAGEKDEHPIDAGFVRSIIRARRLRDQYFQGGLFADPAWDMLLDLMAARLEGNRVAVSSLCIAAAVPATTALRWIKTLTDQGLFARAADPQDGRRVYIELSDETARALSAYLRAVQRIAPVAI